MNSLPRLATPDAWTAEESALLRDIGGRLHPARDEIAWRWAERLTDELGPPFAGNAEAVRGIADLNRWFLESHFAALRDGDIGAIYRENLANDLALLRSQRETFPDLQSSLSQLYLSLQVSTAVILDRLAELYAADPRLPRVLGVYGRLALMIGEALGRAFYEVRSEDTERALRIVSSLLEASRDLNRRSASVAGVLDNLTTIVNRLVRCDKSIAFLWHEDAGAYVAEASRGFLPEHFAEIRAMRFRRGSFAMMDDVLDGRVASGTCDDGRVPRDVMERYGEATYAVAPMIDSDGHPLGTLAAYRSEEIRFDATDLEILTGVAQNAALAIENARLVEKLEATSRLKTDFINSMSHEIRTPINVLIGYVDMLADRRAGDRADLEILRRMRENGGYLLSLVNTILDLGRIEAGKIPMRVETFTVDEVLRSLEDAFGASAASRGLAFECRAVGELPPLSTDRLKLLEILNNLVGNAFKFTDAGSIRVVVRRAPDGWISFEVADTGMGIEPEAIETIFDVFRQAGPSDRGGTGLGLYIARRLSKLLGGSVEVESEPGRGSVFRLRIPSALVVAEAAEPRRARL